MKQNVELYPNDLTVYLTVGGGELAHEWHSKA